MSDRHDLMAMNCCTVEQVSKFRTEVLRVVGELENELTAMRERAEKAEADVKVARGQFEGACIIIDQLAQRIREFEENNGN